MSHDPRLRSAIAVLTGSAVVVRVIGAGTSIITARVLGPSGRGELALLLIVGMVSGVALTMGLDLWVARSRALLLHSTAVRGVLRGHQLLAGVLVVVITAACLLVVPASPIEVAGCALVAWSTTVVMIKLGLLQRSNRMNAYAGASLAGSVMYGALVVAIAVVGSSNTAPFLFATAAGLLVTAAWRCPRPDGVGSGATLSDYLEALRFGLPGMVGGLVTHGLYRLDVALVALWRSTAEAGLYSVALAVTEVLWVLPNSAAQAIVPHASKPASTLDIAQVSRVLVAAMSVGAILVVGLGPFVVPLLFGSEFEGAVDALPGLAAAALAIGVWKLFSFQLLAQGDARARLSTGIVGLLVMVTADAWLVPRWGLVGASVGSLLAYAVAAALCVGLWRRESGVAWRRILILERGDARAIARWRRTSDPTPAIVVDPESL